MCFFNIISLIHSMISLYVLLFTTNEAINKVFEEHELDLYYVIDIVFYFLSMLFSFLYFVR